MIRVNAVGDACPIPIVKAKKAITSLNGSGQVEVTVDNAASRDNLVQMGKVQGYGVESHDLDDGQYSVLFTLGGAADGESAGGSITAQRNVSSRQQGAGRASSDEQRGPGNADAGVQDSAAAAGGQSIVVSSAEKGSGAAFGNAPQGKTVVVFSSRFMGTGDDELGAVLMKSFVFSLTQLDRLPDTMLFYNGGAFLTTAGSPVLEDLKALAAEGVTIQTCGTCLRHYHLEDKLQVGTVTNMYEIASQLMTAGRIVRP